ncbi:adhesion G protein-coupled receptor F5 isoform X2 [Hemicordylus capensis]|uniref:adhesion G protein-coupled receptor F5 isoform X2 n=1 Tax=Hemicordylus capensis TaxID=884348 RepID=UPI0023028337|nr:adhesion G protein-coupled receptor F5 isoform X2 [Hemicordylus capensis]
MLFWRIPVFYTLMIVIESSPSSVDFNFGSLTHSLIHSKDGKEEKNAERVLLRQKRQAATLGNIPTAYTIGIEISFAETSPQEAIRSHLKNLSFPLVVNLPNSATNISSITVSTVCNSTGNNSAHCYCEPGYGWPAEACNTNAVCHNTVVAPEDNCHCIAQLPPLGTYCQLQSEDIPLLNREIRMSVRLNIAFKDDLRNPSSMLHKQYKHDLEKAFTEGYKRLPGFKYAIVTGFRPGSIGVTYSILYEGTSTEPIINASTDVAAALNATYKIDNTSFEIHSEVIRGQTNFSFSPKNIFKGDTVMMKCESKSASTNVTWHVPGSNSTRHTITSEIVNGMAVSRLKITSITWNEAGNYSCTFTEWNNKTFVMYQAEQKIEISPIQIVPSNDVVIVCNGETKELSCCTDREIDIFHPYWRPNGAINISGTINDSHNCTQYLLQANVTDCPAERSGTTTAYTCELSTAEGARNSKVINVTYIVAHVNIMSSTNGIVSEGHPFSLSCKSNVNNHDDVTWEIQAQNITRNVDRIWYTTTETETGVESVLTVHSANQRWNGIYICTFFQNVVNSSANTIMKVFPLPLKNDIIRSPVEADFTCPGAEVLKCCTSKRGNYTVKFNIPQMNIMAESREKDNANCYNYTVVNHCSSTGHVLQAYCEFTNEIGSSVQSSPMILHIVSAKDVSCNCSEIGVGKNGTVVTKPCLQQANNLVKGDITYLCDSSKWRVARNNCLSVEINNLFSSAESLASSPDSVQELPEYLRRLNSTVKKEQQDIKNSTANLKAVVEILNLISVIPADAKQETMEDFLSTVDTVISSPAGTWKDFTNGSSQLLDSVEKFARSLQPIDNIIPPISYDSLQLKGVVINKSNLSDYDKSFSFSKPSSLGGSVLIDEAKIRTLNSNSTIISVAYSALSHIIPLNNDTDELVVNGLVISTTVDTHSILGGDFHINMTFTKSDRSLENPRCVFWNFSFAGDKGGWDETGCESKVSGDNVICFCNHLTSFSILMSPRNVNSVSLDYISYIGVSISILSLVVCIVIEAVVWKPVTKTRISYMRHVCMLNIAVSLLIADIWFIFVAVIHDQGASMDPKICTAAAFFIHFFYLCVFFWMLTLGFMLFYHLFFIFHNTSKTIMKAVGFCLGYGCPLVISVITIAITYPQKSYTSLTKNLCLLNWEPSRALLALVIPAIVIVVVNAAITIVVIAKIRRRSIGENSKNEEKSSLYRIAKSICVLTPLLGLTWGFGFAVVFSKSPDIFHWLFTILNSFQGLFILLFGTLWDRKVREAFGNKCCPSRWNSQQSKSTSQGMSAAMLSIGSPFSRTLNNLFGKTGRYEVSSTEPTFSTSESTSKAYSLLS